MDYTMGFKRVLISAAITVGAFLAVGYTACTKTSEPYEDKCKTVVCKNDGICFKGECSCVAGYSGTYCENKWQTRYLGKWKITEWVYDSNNAGNINDSAVYYVNITPGATGAAMIMGDFKAVPGANMNCNIGLPKIDGKYDPARFIFTANQKLSGTNMVLVEGGGRANDIGTMMTGTYILQYPDTAFGSYVIDSISFKGEYAN